MKTILYVTRHGETEWNVEKRMQGRKNSALTEKGVEQAKLLGERMKNITIDVIYSSPSERATHTAKLIKGDRSIAIIENEAFYEIHMGDWEGMTVSEIEEKYPQDFRLFWDAPHQFRPHSGETFQKAQTRVLNRLQTVLEKHKGQSILIVAHAVAAKYIVGHFENRPTEKSVG
jgi:broad specificity phosphatase PhoE